MFEAPGRCVGELEEPKKCAVIRPMYGHSSDLIRSFLLHVMTFSDFFESTKILAVCGRENSFLNVRPRTGPFSGFRKTREKRPNVKGLRKGAHKYIASSLVHSKGQVWRPLSRRSVHCPPISCQKYDSSLHCVQHCQNQITPHPYPLFGACTGTEFGVGLLQYH